MLLTDPVQTFGQFQNVHVHGVCGEPATPARPRGFVLCARCGEHEATQVITVEDETRWSEVFHKMVTTAPANMEVHLYHLDRAELFTAHQLLNILGPSA